MSVEAIIADFQEALCSANYAESTVRDYAVYVRRFFTFAEGKGVTRLDDIDTDLLEDYQRHVATLRNRRGKPMSPGHRNIHIRVLRVLFRDLVFKKKMAKNPASDVTLVPEPERLPTTQLKPEEADDILDGIPADTPLQLRDRAIVECLYGGGPRSGDITHMDLEHINEADLTVTRRMGKNKRDRMVFLTDRAMYWLMRYVHEARPHFLRGEDEKAVFLSQKTGRRIGAQGIRHIVARWTKAAGLDKHVTPKVFRTSVGTTLLRAGASLHEVQKVLGHAKSRTTAKWYIALCEDEVAEAVDIYHPSGRSSAA